MTEMFTMAQSYEARLIILVSFDDYDIRDVLVTVSLWYPYDSLDVCDVFDGLDAVMASDRFL